MRFIIVTISLLLTFAFKNMAELFTDSVVHELSIEFYDLDASNYHDTLFSAWQQNSWYDSSIYLPAQIIFDGDTLDSVGIRYKGEYSMNGTKKPFKLKFDEYRAQKLDGVKKLNLQGAMEDTSQIHDKLCYDLFNWIGVPAPRASFTKVNVEGTYYGLMTAVEQIDKQFRKYNYEKTEGRVFKGFYGTFGESYEKDDIATFFEPKNHKKAPDFSTLLEIYDVVDTTQDSLLGAELRNRFEMNTFIKHMAVDKATTSYDNFFCGAGANIYYFWDSVTSKFNTIPWDYNLSLILTATSPTFMDGVSTITPDTLAGNGWGNRFHHKKIIREGIFADSANKAGYFREIGHIANYYYEENRINTKLDSLHALIKDAVYLDSTVENSRFDAAFDTLRAYFSWQRNSILTQLTQQGATPNNYIEVVSLSPDVTTLEIGLGDANKVIIPISVSPTNATYQNLNWASADRDIAKVSAFGEVEGKSVGTTTITVSSPNGGTPKQITVTVVDKAVNALKGSSLASNTINLITSNNNIEIKSATPLKEVSLLSLTGRILFSSKNTTIIPTKNLAKGIYCIQVQDYNNAVKTFYHRNK